MEIFGAGRLSRCSHTLTYHEGQDLMIHHYRETLSGRFEVGSNLAVNIGRRALAYKTSMYASLQLYLKIH